MFWPLVVTLLFLALSVVLVTLSVWYLVARERRCHELRASLGKLAAASRSDWLALAETTAKLDLSPQELDRILDGLEPTEAFSRALRAGLEPLATGGEDGGEGGRDARSRRQLLGHLMLLRKAPDPALELPLTSCVLDARASVSGAAALAVGLHPEAYPGAAVAVVEALRAPASHDTRPALTWCLRQLLRARPELFGMLPEEPSPPIRRILMAEMVRLLEEGDAALADMATALAEGAALDPDPLVRRHAFEALRFVRSPRHDVCLMALDDANPQVRGAAGLALAGAGGEALTKLVDKVADSEDAVRQSVLEALERVGDTDIPEGVSRRARQGDPSSRAWTLQALAATLGPAALDELAAALDDPSAEVRTGAARALVKLAFDDECLAALRAVEPRLVAQIDRESEPQALVALAETVIHIGGEAAGEAVLARLASQQDSVRERLLEMLAWYEQFPARLAPAPRAASVAPGEPTWRAASSSYRP